jgi:hypothetical protein
MVLLLLLGLVTPVLIDGRTNAGRLAPKAGRFRLCGDGFARLAAGRQVGAHGLANNITDGPVSLSRYDLEFRLYLAIERNVPRRGFPRWGFHRGESF